MALAARLTIVLQAALTNALDLVTAAAPATVRKAQDFANGTGANQADRIFSDSRTLAASTAEDLDLAGSLEDALGGAFVLAKLKAVLIVASPANANNLIIGGDANGVPIFGDPSDTLILPPGGVFLWTAPSAAGVAVTAGTGDVLQVENGGAGSSVSYDIVLIGASA